MHELLTLLGWALLIGLAMLGALGIAACLGGWEAQDDNRMDAMWKRTP